MSTNETVTRREAVAAINKAGVTVYGWVRLDSSLDPIAVKLVKADVVAELSRFDADDILNYVEVMTDGVWIG